MTVSLSFVAAVVIGGAAFQEAQRVARLTERYQPPGRMVDVGSRALHLYCEGQGTPVVILEAGSGLAYLNWTAVQTGLGGSTRTCSYDRAGLGWSERGGGEPSANRATEDLRELLIGAGIPTPWIIVGHSLGGLYAQQFMNRFGQDVAALVLLDAAHELQFDSFPHWVERTTPSLWESVRPTLSLLGLHRFGRSGVSESDPTWVARELHATPKHVRTAAEEWWSIPLSAEQVRESRTSWGDVPLIVFQAGRLAWPDDWAPREVAEANRKWTEVQLELTNRSSQGQYRWLDQSGHGIPWEHPELVIAAVDSLVEHLRSPR